MGSPPLMWPSFLAAAGWWTRMTPSCSHGCERCRCAVLPCAVPCAVHSVLCTDLPRGPVLRPLHMLPLPFFLFSMLQSPASLALARVAEEGGHVPEELMNHYTIIVPGEDPGNYTQVGRAGSLE